MDPSIRWHDSDHEEKRGNRCEPVPRFSMGAA